MPYTLMKGLAWILAALALGITVGWLLRSVTARHQAGRRTRRADAAEIARLRARVAELETGSSVEPATVEAQAATPLADVEDPPNLPARQAVQDDLTVIAGLGPDEQSLCHAIGIRTWTELSTTEVSLLRTMLRDAGPRFAGVDPTGWPEQAALLAAGRWDEFEALASNYLDRA